MGPRDDQLPGTVRQGLRVFAGTYMAATLVDVVLIGIIKRHGYISLEFKVDFGRRKEIFANLRNKKSFQTALATSVAISLYRTLLRVLSLKQLRTVLPPAFLAGVIAGLGLILHPADSRRVTVTIYFLTRTLEFCYNLLDDKGYLPREKPWWFGSWLIFPLSSAQLLHSFTFDRDCFPQVPLYLSPVHFLACFNFRATENSSSNIPVHTSPIDRPHYLPPPPGPIRTKL